MHCRAVLLLEQELHQLHENSLWGVEVHRVPHHPLICFANIRGLKQSIWENGIFHLTLKFSEHYNEEPPEVIFNTIPFHPNVNAHTGKLCADFLDKSLQRKTEEPITLTNLFLNIQYILSNPVLDDAVNEGACLLLKESVLKYEQTVKECVTESRRLYEVLNSSFPEEILADDYSTRKFHTEIERPSKKESQSNLSSLAKAKQVSFDTYHKTWKQFATTKPVSRYEGNEFKVGDEVTLPCWNADYSDYRSLTPSSNIKVAPNRPRSSLVLKSNNNNIQQKKLDRIAAMKKLYMNRNGSSDINDVRMAALSNSAPQEKTIEKDRDGVEGASEPWEREADELVAWAGKLNEDAM